MPMFEVKVLCVQGACEQVREHMRTNGYDNVTKQIMMAADHYGTLKSKDIDEAVNTARKLKHDLPDKILKVKVIPME